MSVSRSYAKALLEGAIEGKVSVSEIDQFENQLGFFVDLLSNSKELRVALWGPTTSSKEKVAVVKEFLKTARFPKILENFIQLLARKGRLSLLSEIRDAFGAVRLESEGGISGTLISADPIEEGDQKNLALAFSQKLGKKVVFRAHLDPTLLAGVKVTVSGVTYDGTLRAQLQQLRDRLVFGSSLVH